LNAGPRRARPGIRRDASDVHSPEFGPAQHATRYPWWLRRLVNHRGWNRALDDWWMLHCPWCDGYGGQACDWHFRKDTTPPVEAPSAAPSRVGAQPPRSQLKPSRREQSDLGLPKTREVS
jgi:hypothetical protein